MREVHIWSILLDQDPSLSTSTMLLDDEERRRADRFYFERDTRRYIVGRAMLRRILSHHTGLPASELCFTYNPYGKPALVAAQNPNSVEFNLSHSGEYALCAVTFGHAVGVDVEEIKTLDYLQLAGTVFSPREQATLQRLPVERQQLAFFNGWTRKEAYIKAHGKGLSMPLADFDVTLAPNDPVQLQATRPDATEADRWSLFGWTIRGQYVAALAIAGQGWQLIQRQSRELQ